MRSATDATSLERQAKPYQNRTLPGARPSAKPQSGGRRRDIGASSVAAWRHAARPFFGFGRGRRCITTKPATAKQLGQDGSVSPANPLVDQPTPDVEHLLGVLSDALDAVDDLPRRGASADRHLDIRDFAGLAGRWTSAATDSPKRNLADACCLAAIVSRSDVCAIQETRGELTAMLTMLRRLVPSWGVILTDAGQGDAANDERLAYVFDRDACGPAPGRRAGDPPFMVSFEAPPREPDRLHAADAAHRLRRHRLDDANGHLTPPDELLGQPRSIFDAAGTAHY